MSENIRQRGIDSIWLVGHHLYGYLPYRRFLMKNSNEERIDLRLPEVVKEQIRKSAALTGRSMSDFIIAAALRQAEETMASIERWEMNETDSRFVMELLLAPPQKIPALQDLMDGIRSKKMKNKRGATNAALTPKANCE